MLLETSRRYNPSIDSITFLKDFSYNKEDFAKAGAFVLVEFHPSVLSDDRFKPIVFVGLPLTLRASG